MNEVIGGCVGLAIGCLLLFAFYAWQIEGVKRDAMMRVDKEIKLFDIQVEMLINQMPKDQQEAFRRGIKKGEEKLNELKKPL